MTGAEQTQLEEWELSILVQCSEQQATDLMLELDDVTKQRYGAVWAATKVVEADD